MESIEGQGGAQVAQLSERSQAQFELGITLSLFSWPSLSLAVSNNWGGPDSSDKREWLAQTLIDLLKENPDADAAWVEEVLLQAMLDEFEVNVDDDSAYEVAEQIVRLRKDCESGDFEAVRSMKERWDRRGGAENSAALFKKVQRNEEEDETDGSEDVDDDEEQPDVVMEEAPQLVSVRPEVVPEVDEDGFTKVTRKKR